MVVIIKLNRASLPTINLLLSSSTLCPIPPSLDLNLHTPLLFTPERAILLEVMHPLLRTQVPSSSQGAGEMDKIWESRVEVVAGDHEIEEYLWLGSGFINISGPRPAWKCKCSWHRELEDSLLKKDWEGREPCMRYADFWIAGKCWDMSGAGLFCGAGFTGEVISDDDEDDASRGWRLYFY